MKTLVNISYSIRRQGKLFVITELTDLTRRVNEATAERAEEKITLSWVTQLIKKKSHAK